MTKVLLIYPYFNSPGDRSTFRFPPLGIAYLASSLRNQNYEVEILDCTFLDKPYAEDRAKNSHADVVGIYSMASMKRNSLEFARLLRHNCGLIIAGGPLPTADPESFLNDFDIVVKGEGERAILDVIKAYGNGRKYEAIPGIVFRNSGIARKSGKDSEIIFTGPRQMEPDLNSIAFPARDLLPNHRYIDCF